MEVRDDVLSSVGGEDMDTSEYQLSDLEDIELYWEDPDLNKDKVSRPSIDTPFSLQIFLILGWTQWPTT